MADLGWGEVFTAGRLGCLHKWSIVIFFVWTMLSGELWGLGRGLCPVACNCVTGDSFHELTEGRGGNLTVSSVGLLIIRSRDQILLR